MTFITPFLFPLLLFLATLCVTSAIDFKLVQRTIRGTWTHQDGPVIARGLRQKNRWVLGVTLGLVAISGIIEYFSAGYHDLTFDVQDWFAAFFGAKSPGGVIQSKSVGGGVSLAAYVAGCMGVAIGLTLGDFVGCRGFARCRALRCSHFWF